MAPTSTPKQLAAITSPTRSPGAGERLLLVSNRLPLTATIRGDSVDLRVSGGGLATALRDVCGRSEVVWIGWSGLSDGAIPEMQRRVEERLRDHGAIAIGLSLEEAKGFYQQYANGVLWPTLHGEPCPVPEDRRGWALFRTVNERFADTVASSLRHGDKVWVHDYHLMLLPRLLRERVPWARVGFFLHTPFPPAIALDELTEMPELLDGVLGADVIGFHTNEYVENFINAVRLHTKRATLHRAVQVGERRVRLLACPVGVDAEWFSERSQAAPVAAAAAAIRQRLGRPLFLGVDRLDYTKGIPMRLQAFERLLEEEPKLRGRARLLQVAVPTREDVSGYAELRTRVDSLVDLINRKYATRLWKPIEYIYGNLERNALVALYCAVDVMLVTPVCDGMNLVAKEFIASRSDCDGVLVLSIRAGAAAELWAALPVEPADQSSIVDAYRRALEMSPAERRVRMRRLRHTVAEHDVYRWGACLLDAIRAPQRPSRR